MKGQKDSKYKERLIELKRTSTKRKGGPLFHYSALAVVGDEKGQVGISVAKSKENIGAINKAIENAKKNLFKVKLTEDFSIPHELYIKEGASRILMKPAALGSGIIAGGTVRDIAELAGIKNISIKILGTRNPLSNARCFVKGLKSLQVTPAMKKNKTDEIVEGSK